MRLLCDQELGNAVRRMFDEDDDLRCAVAFWGPQMAARAVERNARVVLDVSMGGTSKNALRAFGVKRTRVSEAGARNVRVLDGLHAKLFLSDRSAIVGSANASVNALGGEDRAPRLREAGMLIDRASDAAEYAQIEAAWNTYLDASRPIRPNDLARAASLPNTPAARDGPASNGRAETSMLDALQQRPEDFADTVFVFGDFGVEPTEIEAAEIAYEAVFDERPRKTGRTHVALLSGQRRLERTLRTASQVVTYWFGEGPGLYAYRDMNVAEHADGDVTFFGREGWAAIRGSLGFRSVRRDEIWVRDVERARKLAKSDGERKGERFVVMSSAELYEALERSRGQA